ncbi:hypothetical protein D7V80_28310, partial [Corallococcus sp. CA054B]
MTSRPLIVAALASAALFVSPTVALAAPDAGTLPMPPPPAAAAKAAGAPTDAGTAGPTDAGTAAVPPAPGKAAVAEAPPPPPQKVPPETFDNALKA